MAESQSPFEKPTLDKDLDKLSFIEASTQSVMSRAAAPGLAIIFLVLVAWPFRPGAKRHNDRAANLIFKDADDGES